MQSDRETESGVEHHFWPEQRPAERSPSMRQDSLVRPRAQSRHGRGLDKQSTVPPPHMQQPGRGRVCVVAPSRRLGDLSPNLTSTRGRCAAAHSTSLSLLLSLYGLEDLSFTTLFLFVHDTHS
jgi:hypothetical protein